MLAVDAQHELARDRDGGGQDREDQDIRPEEEAERQPRDEGAPRIERCASGEPAGGGLHDEDRRQDGDRVSGRQVELEPPQPVDEQASQRRDLIEPRIDPAPALCLGLPLGRRRGDRHAP